MYIFYSKTISSNTKKKLILVILCCIFLSLNARAQLDSTLFKRSSADTSKLKMNMDAIYSRPFLQMGKLPVSLGGYIEGNTSYFGTDGVSEGLSFQLPRMTIFISSTIKKRIKFLSEIELEEGGKEINIEFASMDVELHPMLNFRGGVIMNPIGSFNQNHDGPKWEFISRPISSTTIIPSTWSNVGFGFFGKYGRKNIVYAYEAYLTNGFDDKIINNSENKTFLPASKANPERFEESSNGFPLATIKGALKHRRIGEFGLSWMGGIYNQFQKDGVKIDSKRRIDVYALDLNSTIQKTKTYINCEFVVAKIDLPDNLSEEFGDLQFGSFMDIVQPVLRKSILGWENSLVNLALRLEYTDYNIGTFKSTGEEKRDDVYAIVPGVSFRPSAQTVFRANYRFEERTDLLGNPPSLTAGFQFGFSTYF